VLGGQERAVDLTDSMIAEYPRSVPYDQIASNSAWSNGTSQHSAIRP